MTATFPCCAGNLLTQIRLGDDSAVPQSDSAKVVCPHAYRSTCRMVPVLSFIGSTPIDQLSDQRAAVAIGLSTSRFRHLFKEHTGVSFHKFIVQVRLERACFLLRTTMLTIQEIGRTVGIDQSHFRRDFKRTFGTTPADYRRLCADAPDTLRAVGDLSTPAMESHGSCDGEFVAA